RAAAYAQVSPARRWLLHRRVAQGLELLHADDPDAVSAQLAEQYARGGRVERAVGYYRRAAELAAGMFAHAESIRLHKEALALIQTMPEGRDRQRQELAGLEAMAAPLNASYGYSSPELQRTVQRSIALAEEVGSRDSVLTGLVGLWTTQFVQGDNLAAYETATRALSLVEPDSAASAPAHFAIGGSAVSLGRLAEAVRHLELAVTLGGSDLLSVGTRPDVHGRAFAAHAYWLLGAADKAAQTAAEAVAVARTTDSPYNVAVALAYAGVTAQLGADASALEQRVGELRELCDRYDFAYYREWAKVLLGWSLGGPAGLELARRGVDNLRSEGSIARMPYWLTLLADLYAGNGLEQDARGTLDGALVVGSTSVDLWWLPEVMRMRAAYDDRPAAIERLRAAEQQAAEQGSRTLRRRCQADLAALGVRSA
ncbi:MAG: family transcriptional regulator, partial [Frankiales bacterium]|nr:family transcriptional regulator [Frankiales bacterium]